VTKPDKPGIESVLQEARFQEGPTEFGKRTLKKSGLMIMAMQEPSKSARAALDPAR